MIRIKDPMMIGFLFLALALQFRSPLTVGGFVERLKIEGVQVEVAGLDLKAPLTEGAVVAIGDSLDLHFTTNDAAKLIPREHVALLVHIFKPEAPVLNSHCRRKGRNHSPHDPHDSHDSNEP